MASEFTRKRLLDESVRSGTFAPSEESTEVRYYTPTSISKKSLTDLQNERKYDAILQRIRGSNRHINSEGRQNNCLDVNVPNNRSHSLSPGIHSATTATTTCPNCHCNGNGMQNTNAMGTSESNLSSGATLRSNFHSRHLEFLKRRQQEYSINPFSLDQSNTYATASTIAGESGVGTGSDVFATRPTYTVRNIPVRNLDELRETIGIRRQYYKDKLFGKPEGKDHEQVEGDGGNDGEGDQHDGSASPECHGQAAETLAFDLANMQLASKENDSGSKGISGQANQAMANAVEHVTNDKCGAPSLEREPDEHSSSNTSNLDGAEGRESA